MPTTIKMISHKIWGHETIELYPIGDLHVGSKEFNEPQYQKLSRYIMDAPNRFVVLTGDLVDNGIKSSVTSGYDAVMQPAAQRHYAADLLYPIKDRILAIVSGNHEYRSRKDTDTDPAELIAERLELSHVFQPDIAFLKLDLGERPNHNIRPPMYCVGITHGAGGGMMLGAGLSKSEAFALSVGVDLLISGHSHKPATAPTVRYECNMAKGVMVAREVRIMVATGWLDYGGYPARKMLRPVVVRPNCAVLNCAEHDVAVLS